MSKVLKFIGGLFVKRKLAGTQALTKALLDMAKVVTELDDTLDEANSEAQDQADRVRVAKVELQRINDVIEKGETFLTGLKGLFGMTD
jgi:polyribonucleotide nucleotidyltransferase